MDQVNNEDNEENEQIKDNNEVDIKISMNISVKCEKFFQIEDTTKYDSFKFPFCLVNIADRVWVGCKDGTIVIYDTRSSVRQFPQFDYYFEFIIIIIIIIIYYYYFIIYFYLLLFLFIIINLITITNGKTEIWRGRNKMACS